MTHPEVLDESDVLLRLTNLEVEQKRLDDLIAGWTRGGVTNPYFDVLYANEGVFSSPPLEFTRVRDIVQASSVETATTHVIAWTDNIMNTGFIQFSTVVGVSTRLHVPTADANKKAVHISGQVALENTGSTVGGVILRLEAWRPDGTLNGAVDVHRQDGPDDEDFHAYPFTHVLRVHSSITAFSLAVIQNSGTSMRIDNAYMNVLRVF